MAVSRADLRASGFSARRLLRTSTEVPAMARTTACEGKRSYGQRGHQARRRMESRQGRIAGHMEFLDQALYTAGLRVRCGLQCVLHCFSWFG